MGPGAKPGKGGAGRQLYVSWSAAGRDSSRTHASYAESGKFDGCADSSPSRIESRESEHARFPDSGWRRGRTPPGAADVSANRDDDAWSSWGTDERTGGRMGRSRKRPTGE